MTVIQQQPLRALSRAEVRQINRWAWVAAERRRRRYYERLRARLIDRARHTHKEPNHGNPS